MEQIVEVHKKALEKFVFNFECTEAKPPCKTQCMCRPNMSRLNAYAT